MTCRPGRSSAGVLLQSAQTTLAAAAWLAILRAAYPRVKITFRLILASYATAVAMNSFLPANIGTWVMLIMFTTVIAGATFTAMLSGITVQKIPFSVFNIAVYLYLFARSPAPSRSSSAGSGTTGCSR